VGHSTPEYIRLFNELSCFVIRRSFSFGKLPMQSINMICGNYGNTTNDLWKNYARLTRRIIKLQWIMRVAHVYNRVKKY